MKYALTSGRARTSTPTRLSDDWPRTIAQTIAVMPAATNARPRTVSPESASRMAAPALDYEPAGTGTLATIASRIAEVERPLMEASTLGSSRCASTGRASPCTSSGST